MSVAGSIMQACCSSRLFTNSVVDKPTSTTATFHRMKSNQSTNAVGCSSRMKHEQWRVIREQLLRQRAEPNAPRPKPQNAQLSHFCSRALNRDCMQGGHPATSAGCPLLAKWVAKASAQASVKNLKHQEM